MSPGGAVAAGVLVLTGGQPRGHRSTHLAGQLAVRQHVVGVASALPLSSPGGAITGSVQVLTGWRRRRRGGSCAHAAGPLAVHQHVVGVHDTLPLRGPHAAVPGCVKVLALGEASLVLRRSCTSVVDSSLPCAQTLHSLDFTFSVKFAQEYTTPPSLSHTHLF